MHLLVAGAAKGDTFGYLGENIDDRDAKGGRLTERETLRRRIDVMKLDSLGRSAGLAPLAAPVNQSPEARLVARHAVSARI